MDTLTEIFTTLRDYGYCMDQQDFSRNWLGRSASYYAHLRSSGQRCSLASIGMLVGRLRELIAVRGQDDRGGEQRPDDGGDEQRRLGAAWIAAKVMYLGEWELLHVRPRDRITAIPLGGWIDIHDL
jgi:hypothetical protein